MTFKRTYLLIVSIAALLAAQAQDADLLRAEKCFVEAPAQLLNVLSKTQRLDMVDYFKAGSDRPTTNDFGGESVITSLQPEAISFNASERVSYQIFVLNPASKTPLIGIIETTLTPIPDSRMRIFSSAWKQKVDLSVEPKLADWLTPEGKKQQELVKSQLPYILATYKYDPATLTLTIAHGMDKHFALGEGDKVLPLIKKELRYKWDGRKFKLQK